MRWGELNWAMSCSTNLGITFALIRAVRACLASRSAGATARLVAQEVPASSIPKSS